MQTSRVDSALFAHIQAMMGFSARSIKQLKRWPLVKWPTVNIRVRNYALGSGQMSSHHHVHPGHNCAFARLVYVNWLMFFDCCCA